MKIENKEMLLYSMKKAIDEAREVVNIPEEVYYRIGTALHWIVDCYDRISESGMQMSEEELAFREALHAANNALKHRCDLIVLHKKSGGLKYPKKYPFAYKVYYAWANIDNVKLRSQKQKEIYARLIEGENIIDTFMEAEKIIEAYYACDAESKME